MSKQKPTPERKAALTQICDAESYVAIIRESLTEEQIKAFPPIHLANVLALTAELFLLYHDSIGRSFTTANELAVTLTCKLAKDKDNVEIAFLPVAKFKDSASATVEDDHNQPDLGNIKKEAHGRAPKPPKHVPALPAPAAGMLPAPERTEEEAAAYDSGRDARSTGAPSTANPFPARSQVRACWKQGWQDRDREIREAQGGTVIVEAEVIEPDDAATGNVEIVDEDDKDADHDRGLN